MLKEPISWGAPVKNRSHRLILCLLLPASLAACFTSPYQVAPPSDVAIQVQEATPASGPARTTIAICYNGFTDTPAEVMAQAREVCPHGGEIERVAEDAYWNPCSLSHPTRAVFACTPGEAPPSKYK